MKHAKDQRELRRAVADLAQCTIEDIESVWAEFSPDDRARLQPLLSEAAGLGGSELPGRGAVPGMSRRTASPSSPVALPVPGDTAACVARIVTMLPKALAVRLLAAVDSPTQAKVLDTLSDAQRAALEPALCDIHLTQRAQSTWLAACLAQAAEVHSPQAPETQTRKQTLLGRVRNWTGRRA